MTLTEILERWAHDTAQAHGGPPRGVVVSPELFRHLADEQGRDPPVVSEMVVLPVAAEAPATDDLPGASERVEIPGPDRVSVYVGVDPQASAFPPGLDPAMPVVFVPVPPDRLEDWSGLETYSQLRWFGLSPGEALAGARP